MKLFARNAGNRRIRERQKGASLAGAKRILSRTIGIASGVALVAGGWFWLTRTDSFAVRNVAIEGTTPERADEIRGLLAITPGTTSLLFLDLADARTHVEAHPWVARAFVKRELPDTLRIVVEEREPKLVLALDRLYYVDASGTPFKALVPGDHYDLPVLTGLTREQVQGKAATAHDAIAGALALIAACSSKDSAGALPVEEISEIRWDERRGYSVLGVKGNEEIVFGTGDWESKLARLKEVREARKSSAEARTIDLTFASRVVVSR